MSKMFLYPTLTSRLEDAIGFDYYDPTFYFHSEVTPDLLEEIVVEMGDEKDILLVDQNRNWSVLHDDIEINQRITIDDPSILFGFGGIISENSMLGIAVSWHSRSSRQQGTIPIGHFDKQSTKIDLDFTLKFQEKQLREKMGYSIVLYSYSVEADTGYFADNTGYILGTLFETSITLEGEGSSLNIVCVSEENAPLWDLYCDWEDVNSSFEDSVRLKLNELHPDYKYLDKLNKNYDEQFFSEILISVVVQMIMTAKEKDQIDEMINTEVASDSIGALIKYYISTYEVDYSTISNIYSSVVRKVRG